MYMHGMEVLPATLQATIVQSLHRPLGPGVLAVLTSDVTQNQQADLH